MPRLNTMAQTETEAADPGLLSGLGSSLRQGVSKVTDSMAMRNLLDGFGLGTGKHSSADGSLLEGIGGLVGGFGQAFKGMSETNQAMMQAFLGGKSGGGDQSTLMVLLMMQMMQQQSETSRQAFEARMVENDRHWQERYADLQQRSGPSQADHTVQQMMTHFLGQSLQKMNEPAKSAAATLTESLAELQKIQGALPGGASLFGHPGDLTANQLKQMELHNDLQKAIHQWSAEAEGKKATTALVQAIGEHGPNIIQSAAVGAVQVLASLGLIPNAQPGVGAPPPPAPRDDAESAAWAAQQLAEGGAQ